MLLGVLNNLFGHDLALKTTQRAFNRFTLIYSNYCHSLYTFLFIDPKQDSYLTRVRRFGSSSQRLLREDNLGNKDNHRTGSGSDRVNSTNRDSMTHPVATAPGSVGKNEPRG